jgi:hypothetical protein
MGFEPDPSLLSHSRPIGRPGDSALIRFRRQFPRFRSRLTAISLAWTYQYGDQNPHLVLETRRLRAQPGLRLPGDRAYHLGHPVDGCQLVAGDAGREAVAMSGLYQQVSEFFKSRTDLTAGPGFHGCDLP